MTVPSAAPARPSAFGQAHRLSLTDYHRMGEMGILGPELRTELIDGEIIEMPPIGHPHAGTVDLLADRLREAVGRRAVVRVQNPIWLDDHSEPLPDIALLRSRADYYRKGHPGPDDVLLLIEVADSSLAYDQNVKLPRYARAGIAEAWLVDLGGRALTRHRRPGPQGYQEVCAVAAPASVMVTLAGGEQARVDLTMLF